LLLRRRAGFCVRSDAPVELGDLAGADHDLIRRVGRTAPQPVAAARELREDAGEYNLLADAAFVDAGVDSRVVVLDGADLDLVLEIFRARVEDERANPLADVQHEVLHVDASLVRFSHRTILQSRQFSVMIAKPVEAA